MDLIRLNIAGKQPAPLTETEFRHQSAVLSAVCAVAVSLLLRFTAGALLIPELLADRLFALIPIRIVEFGVSLFGPFAKHAAFVGCTVIYGAFLTLLASEVLRWSSTPPREAVDPRPEHPSFGAWRIALVSGSIFAVNALILIPILGGGFAGLRLPQSLWLTTASLALASAVQGAALIVAPRILEPSSSVGSGLEGTVSERLRLLTSRRRLLRLAGYSVVALAVYDIAWSWIGAWRQSRSGRVRDGNGAFPFINGLAREVTPADEFYEVSKNAFDPAVDVRGWGLRISGLVETPISLNLDQIKSLPAVEQYATLECISNEVGGNLIGNALWRG
ncbi:MAG TPA: molybdopterin-dependent oxidoreductase, partial [Blastocatellia bacterium]|nr:molybdopterin-dependent oxidoreductase [Blastocatellia bacterium]